jgi:hypothetical protein
MQIYLPIAEMTIPAESIFLLSTFVGLLSGIFGVGGGFLTTPFLMFFGIPPAVAVGTQATQLVAAGTAGFLGHMRRGNVDVKMGVVMLGGGVLGSVIGAIIFKILSHLGQIDFAVSISYVILLTSIAILMIMESFSSVLFHKKKNVRKEFNTLKVSNWMDALPYKMRFPRSKLFISALIPGGLGFLGGVLASVMGVGGAVFLVPAMIYILGMPALLVAGTSLFQIVFTTVSTTVIHAVLNQSVDMLLAVILILGGVVGAQIGVSLARHVKGVYGRILLAGLIVVVVIQLSMDLFIKPVELFSTVNWF